MDNIINFLSNNLGKAIILYVALLVIAIINFAIIELIVHLSSRIATIISIALLFLMSILGLVLKVLGVILIIMIIVKVLI